MQNYHKHSSWSNIFVPDSSTSYEDYAKRAVELGHGILSSVEHGWQGYYYQVYELAQKYNLKFVFGAEAYWVKDRLKEYPETLADGSLARNKDGEVKYRRDNSNCHIILLAKNERGRRAINSILSTANEDGYYFKPRVDLPLLMSLPADDVVVTTACVAYWKYEDIEEITVQMHEHFGSNFYLEIQYHDTDKQREISKRTLELSKKYNIPMIVGLDSHYITNDQIQEREYILEAKGVKYEDEEGWFMDYPDDQTVVERFLKQGVFSLEDIRTAMTYLGEDMFDSTESENLIRLIKLRNPWGSFEWTGRYGDTSDEWQDPRLVIHFKFEAKDDGMFWINDEDFCKNFSSSTVKLL